MLYLLKIKIVLCLGLLFGLFCCPTWAAEHIAENKLITEIKKELTELKQIQENISSKIPAALLEKFELKERIFAQFGDYFKEPKRYNEYIHTLTPGQRKDFSAYKELLFKELASKEMLSNDIRDMLGILKKHAPDEKKYSQIVEFYDRVKIKPSGLEMNKCKMLQAKLKIPDDFVDFLIQSAKFQGAYRFYFIVLSAIKEPVEQKKTKIKQLMAKLYEDNKNEVNIEKRNNVEAFYKATVPLLWEERKKGPDYYYRIKLFSDCMQPPQGQDIKKVLQDSKLMREAVVSLMIGDGSRDVSIYVKEYNQRLNYDNFEAYWVTLQEISKNLTKQIFPRMTMLDKYSPEEKQAGKLNAQCYLECFFTPYLDLNNK